MAPHKRTRTGCWTCREAGYKCDEQKPYCSRCIRLNIPCKGYGVKLKWQDGNLSTPAKRPRRATRKTSLEADASGSPVSIVTSASTPRNYASPKDLTTSPVSAYSAPLVLAASPSLIIDFSSRDRWLFQYWIERLSTLISVVPRRGHISPFQQHLTAMVYDSLALRSTILSMAANHLALSSNNNSWKVHAYHHQQDAIHELQAIIQEPSEAVTEPALATVLMMQVSARLFGDDDDTSVANHLAGAKAMISRREHVPSECLTSSTKFLLSLFAYHDILSSVSRGSRPLADHESVFAAVEGDTEMQSIAQILLAVARISQLQHAIKARREDPTEVPLSEAENAMGQEIQQELLALDFTESSQQVLDIKHTAEAYRHAAFIYLYRTWLGIGAPNPISMDHVQKCLEYIQKLDVGSPLTSAHVWPLFTAGCEATDVIQRQFVRERFAQMYATKNFPSLQRVMRDIEEVWIAKEAENRMAGQEGMAKVDCIQVILRRRGREVDLA
ncbi:fungal-specific transcription factor domain-containing protein [Phaeosphaeria sp. MPI-PUGE-AT-0046c]|nr:fungal-specific transcription factor domain-containing protein [Phaeosphaeria sp. MPI-PUGE-AT-0046c]